MRLAQLLNTGTLQPNNTRQPLHDAVTCTRAAENFGWDEVWTTEHQFNPYVINPCAITLAGYLLGQTKRLTIGTGIVVLPGTHPVRLAAQAAVLQTTSGGRLRLGVGRGSQTLELEVFGDMEAWRTGFPEALAEVKRLLETGEVDDDVPLVPTPPPTPMLVAATREASVETAARVGVPFLVAFPFPDAFKARLLDVYRSTAEANGNARDPGHWVSVLVHVGDSREQARQAMLDHYVPWTTQGTASAKFLERPKQSGSQQHEQMIDMQAFGTPEDVADRLDELMTLCGTRNLLILPDTTLDLNRTLENMERITSEVKPLLV